MYERTVVIEKKDLIEKIKTHKNNHIKEYDEAVEIYKREANKKLNAMKRDISNGKINVRFDLNPPISRVDQYDKILMQLEWEKRDELELQQNEFNQYVLDEYGWRQQASLSNSFYLDMK